MAATGAESMEARMSDHIYPEVELINRRTNVAILSDGQEVPITNWINADGECNAEDAVTCVCGPCFDNKWYSVDLREYEHATIN